MSKSAADREKEIRPRLPNSKHPTFAFARVWDEKTIALRTEDEKIQPEWYTISGRDGESQLVQRTIETRETVKFPTTHVSVTKVPNIEVTTAAVPSVLTAETLAVMSADGKPVDPTWLLNLQEGALVIVAPSTLVPGYSVPTFGPPRLVETPQQAAPQPVPQRPR